jgi:hypothetical protein
MRSLIEVLNDGPARLEKEIEVHIRPLDFVSLQCLMKLDADSPGNMTHSLIESRCFNQPEPMSPQYLAGDVLESTVASPAVWKKLFLIHARKQHSRMVDMVDLFCRIPQAATSAGWLWESLCHDQLRNGGTFNLQAMVSTMERS